MPVLPPERPGCPNAPGGHRPLPDPAAVRLCLVPDSAPPYDDEVPSEAPDRGRETSSGPATGEPTAGRPTAGRPTAGRPTAGRPTAGRPTAGRPTAGRPTAGRPTAGRPTAGRPVDG